MSQKTLARLRRAKFQIVGDLRFDIGDSVPYKLRRNTATL